MSDALAFTTKAVITAAFVVSGQIALAGSLSEPGLPQGTRLGILMQNIVIFTETILIPFLMAIALLFFIWGVFQYFMLESTDVEGRGKAKSHIVYAVAGFVFILIFWGVINLLAGSTGLEGEVITDLPRPYVGD